MFYLKEVLNLFKKNFFLTSSLGVLTFLLYLSVANFTDVQKVINSKLPQVENEHYFNALVNESINVFSVKRKIEGLPGVRGVMVLSEQDSLARLKGLTSALGLSNEEFSSLKEMVALKIALNSKVSQSSIKLIREYMVRLTGKTNILMGSVKYKISNERVFKKLIHNVKKWPLQIAIGVGFLLWSIVFFLLRREVVRVSYIVENFQRKKNVAMKMTLVMVGCFLIASSLVSLNFFNPDWTYTLGFVVIMMVFPFSLYGKKEWVKA